MESVFLAQFNDKDDDDRISVRTELTQRVNHFLLLFYKLSTAQSAGAVEYTDCISLKR